SRCSAERPSRGRSRRAHSSGQTVSVSEAPNLLARKHTLRSFLEMAEGSASIATAVGPREPSRREGTPQELARNGRGFDADSDNALKHGHYTADAIARRIRDLLGP